MFSEIHEISKNERIYNQANEEKNYWLRRLFDLRIGDPKAKEIREKINEIDKTLADLKAEEVF